MARILIIDDDVAVRRLLKLALERAGHHVAEARDGSEGMLLFRSAPADLVVTDLYMPGQDGIETIQLLRDEFPDCRVLAISGGTVADREGALTDAELFGADATLAKPFDMDVFTRVVGDLLQRQ